MNDMMIDNTRVLPLVSVIIPVYNVEKWLPDCIRSLVNQTLLDMEFIFVDDKSTDSSLSILRDASQFDDRVRVISHSINKRQGGAEHWHPLRKSRIHSIL